MAKKFILIDDLDGESVATKTVQTVVEAPKPVAVPAAEFSAELPPVVTTNAKNTGKAKAGAK